jgi:lysophospholipase L1-like esterase
VHDALPPPTGDSRLHSAATTAVLIAVLTAVITASFTLSTTRIDVVGRASAVPVDRPLRIMIAGDSITHQRDGDHTWRARLWEELERQQVSVDFVGPRDTTRGIGYTPGARFDPDHAALGGTTVAVEKHRIRRQVASHRPDVLVVPLGHNDLGHGASPAEVAADMRAYVREARAAKPRLRIVLGTVMAARKDGRSKFRGSNRVLNEHYRHIAAELGTRRSPIVVAATAHPGWNPARDTFDGVHLTPSGEEKFMVRIAAALHHPRIGALPDEPRAARTRVRWDPRPAPVVTPTRDGHRIALPYRKRRINATSVVVHLRSLDRPAWHHRLPGSGRRGRVTVDPAAGTYRVRLQPVRDSMRARPGPAVTFTVD